MVVFIYGYNVKQEDHSHIRSLFAHLEEVQSEFYVFETLHTKVIEAQIVKQSLRTWSSYEDIQKIKPQFVISVGGDGTILNAVTYVRDSGVPIVGMNLGRLGFLASIEKKLIPDAIYQLQKGMYHLETRSLLEIHCNHPIFGITPFALNDFTILKRDTSSMITIHTYVNGEFLNSYWADGIIVATPTGSTGYSLSCGGPIIFPNSGSLVITPVAPHNLNVRPIVLSDESVISFKVEGRTENFLCTLDSRYETITSEHQIAVKKGSFDVKLVHLHSFTFLKTIHEKLNWGLDQRN